MSKDRGPKRPFNVLLSPLARFFGLKRENMRKENDLKASQGINHSEMHIEIN